MSADNRPFGILTKWVTARTPSGRAPETAEDARSGSARWQSEDTGGEMSVTFAASIQERTIQRANIDVCRELQLFATDRFCRYIHLHDALGRSIQGIRCLECASTIRLSETECQRLPPRGHQEPGQEVSRPVSCLLDGRAARNVGWSHIR